MKTLIEQIEVMQAADDGADIEFKAIDNDHWISSLHPFWNWRLCDYRIAKPKLREFWRNYYGSNKSYDHRSKSVADSAASLSPDRTECVHFREVPEDE